MTDLNAINTTRALVPYTQPKIGSAINFSNIADAQSVLVAGKGASSKTEYKQPYAVGEKIGTEKDFPGYNITFGEVYNHPTTELFKTPRSFVTFYVNGVSFDLSDFKSILPPNPTKQQIVNELKYAMKKDVFASVAVPKGSRLIKDDDVIIRIQQDPTNKYSLLKKAQQSSAIVEAILKPNFLGLKSDIYEGMKTLGQAVVVRRKPFNKVIFETVGGSSDGKIDESVNKERETRVVGGWINSGTSGDIYQTANYIVQAGIVKKGGIIEFSGDKRDKENHLDSENSKFAGSYFNFYPNDPVLDLTSSAAKDNKITIIAYQHNNMSDPKNSMRKPIEKVVFTPNGQIFRNGVEFKLERSK